MSKEIIICEQDRLAAIVEGGRVVEFFLSEGDQQVGDIILGRVESVVPAIEAAFIHIGRDKNGFIHVADLPTSRGRQGGIKNILRLKQSLLVQVAKEPTGTKGARLTGMISIAGRYLVLTPFERRIGISRRISSDIERSRLLRIVRQVSHPGYGVIIRTEAEGQKDSEIIKDLEEVLSRWQEILRLSEEVSPPNLLYRDQDQMHRVLRDSLTPDVRRIMVDTTDAQRRSTALLKSWNSPAARLVKLHQGHRSLAAQYGLYREMDTAIQPRVQLPSGGYLIIEQTEALTVIDVNSGKLTTSDNLPETILRTNREAAVEVARQIRLRDIGGMIIVDFIDMTDPRHQQIVWQNLLEAIKPDKAMPQIHYFSELGLIEMTRRRQRQSLNEQLTQCCQHCQGVGRIRNHLYRSDLLNATSAEQRGAVSAIWREIVHEPMAVERRVVSPDDDIQIETEFEFTGQGRSYQEFDAESSEEANIPVEDRFISPVSPVLPPSPAQPRSTEPRRNMNNRRDRFGRGDRDRDRSSGRFRSEPGALPLEEVVDIPTDLTPDLLEVTPVVPTPASDRRRAPRERTRSRLVRNVPAAAVEPDAVQSDLLNETQAVAPDATLPISFTSDEAVLVIADLAAEMDIPSIEPSHQESAFISPDSEVIYENDSSASEPYFSSEMSEHSIVPLDSVHDFHVDDIIIPDVPELSTPDVTSDVSENESDVAADLVAAGEVTSELGEDETPVKKTRRAPTAKRVRSFAPRRTR